MYRAAQIWIHHLLCLILASFALRIHQDTQQLPTPGTIVCPTSCICLSPKQVLCNTGELQEIPTRRLASTVEELSLSKNNFPVIKSDAFCGNSGGLRSLRKLYLDRNNISLIKHFAFRGCNKLEELSIRDTTLPFISEYAFAGLQNVTLIMLDGNKISYIEGYSFTGTSNVKLIVLVNNPLHTIHSNAFSNVRNVGKLILPSGIRKIESDAFNDLQEVGFLKLNFMDLESLQAFTFRGLSNVSHLYISDSDLGVIRKNAFEGLRYVSDISIMNNKIDAIEQLHLTEETTVNSVRWHGNHILRAPRRGGVIFYVRNINVTKNYFPCDCQIHMVLESDFAKGHTREFGVNNFCISPLDYNGKAIAKIDVDIVARCHDKMVKDNLGSSTTIIQSSLLRLTFMAIFWFHIA